MISHLTVNDSMCVSIGGGIKKTLQHFLTSTVLKKAEISYQYTQADKHMHTRTLSHTDWIKLDQNIGRQRCIHFAAGQIMHFMSEIRTDRARSLSHTRLKPASKPNI